MNNVVDIVFVALCGFFLGAGITVTGAILLGWLERKKE